MHPLHTAADDGSEPSLAPEGSTLPLVTKQPPPRRACSNSTFIVMTAIFLTVTCVTVTALTPVELGFAGHLLYMETAEFWGTCFALVPLFPMVLALLIMERARDLGADEVNPANRQLSNASTPTALEVLAFLFTPGLLIAVITAEATRDHYFWGAWVIMQCFVAFLVALSAFRLMLKMRSMLLGLYGRRSGDCAHAMLTRIRLILVMQVGFLVLLNFNMRCSNKMSAALHNHDLRGDRNCTSKHDTEYYQCICAGVTSEYLQQECNLTAGTLFGGGLAVVLEPQLGFTNFVCTVQPEWYPYRNVMTACRSVIAYQGSVFLIMSTQYLLWGLVFLWMVLEYDGLVVAENSQMSLVPDFISDVARSISRFGTAIVALFVVTYTCVQLSNGNWYLDRSKVVGEADTQTYMATYTFFAAAVLASTAAFFHTMWRSKVIGENRQKTLDHYDCFLTHGIGHSSFCCIPR